MTKPTTVLIGAFEDSPRAERFVDELKRAGFREDQIGVVGRREEAAGSPVEQGAIAGVLTGGAWGVLLGTAVATGLIPGIGPVIAGGLLAGLLGSTAVGAAAGGILGALVGLGIPEDEARHYENQLQAGRTLVVVKGNGRLAEAGAILRRVQEAEAPPAKGT